MIGAFIRRLPCENMDTQEECHVKTGMPKILGKLPEAKKRQGRIPLKGA